MRVRLLMINPTADVLIISDPATCRAAVVPYSPHTHTRCRQTLIMVLWGACVQC